MTTPSAVYNGTIYEAMKIFNLGLDATMAGTAFLAYSHFVSLGLEIQYIWSAPIRPASCLYLLIRYPALLYQLIESGLNSYTPHCNSIARLAEWSESIADIATYLMLILRTYAVCGRNRYLAALLLALCLPVLGIDVLISMRSSCTNYNVISPLLEIVGSISDLVFESVVVGATIWVTWSQATMKDESGMSRRTIGNSLLCNGIVYYGIFLGLQICALVSDNLILTPSTGKLGVFVGQFVDPIRWVLTSQFILELRERSQKLGSMSDMSLQTVSSLHGAGKSLQEAINYDFGEPLVHPIHRMDVEMDEFWGSEVCWTGQAETRRELEEATELCERCLGNQNDFEA